MTLHGYFGVLTLGFALALSPSVRAFDLYSNGPFPADTNQGYAFVGQSGDPETLAVSNSFVLPVDSTLDTVVQGIGVLGDYVPESFYWNIGSTAFSTTMGGTVFIFSADKVGEDSFGNANFSVAFSLSGLALPAGTYWLTLSPGPEHQPRFRFQPAFLAAKHRRFLSRFPAGEFRNPAIDSLRILHHHRRA